MRDGRKVGALRTAAGTLSLLTLLGAQVPAQAQVGAGYRTEGTITVSDDFSACLSVRLDGFEFVGAINFAMTGVVTDGLPEAMPVSDTATWLGTLYPQLPGSVSHCFPAPKEFPAGGAVEYTIDVHALGHHYVATKTCVKFGIDRFICTPDV
jgi:hypothetical protein